MSNYLHFDKKFKIDLTKTKEFVKRNPDILITRADKVNATVIIKKSLYIEKLESLFCDNKYYEKIVSYRLPSLERRTNELTKWFNKIDFTATRTKLEPALQKFNISKAYGLIQITKTDFLLNLLFSL